MAEHPLPVVRAMSEMSLIGLMAIYDTHAEAIKAIPHQWREFRMKHPALGHDSAFHGASPSIADHKLHYLTGIALQGLESEIEGERLVLDAGEYAVIQVDDASRLRDTWTWSLESWLPASGRREKNAPEFERFAGISEDGLPIGPIEIWIPLEPSAG